MLRLAAQKAKATSPLIIEPCIALAGQNRNGRRHQKSYRGPRRRMLASFYTDDAVVRVIDRNNPPSKPREIKDRAAIDMFWDDICSRAMAHKVETKLADGDKLAFTQACSYPDGARYSASR